MDKEGLYNGIDENRAVQCARENLTNNPEEAIGELMTLALAGSRESAWLLGEIYYDGKYVKQNLAQSLHYLNMNPSDQEYKMSYMRARILDKLGRYTESFRIYENIVQYDYLPSIYRLGLAFRYGAGTKLDFEKGRQFLNLAYRRGHVGAGLELGLMYMKGTFGVFGFLYGLFVYLSSIKRHIKLGLAADPKWTLSPPEFFS